MRVYYENTHEHETANANKSGMKSEGNIVVNINRVGGGNVSKSKRKREFIDESDESEQNNDLALNIKVNEANVHILKKKKLSLSEDLLTKI